MSRQTHPWDDDLLASALMAARAAHDHEAANDISNTMMRRAFAQAGRDGVAVGGPVLRHLRTLAPAPSSGLGLPGGAAAVPEPEPEPSPAPDPWLTGTERAAQLAALVPEPETGRLDLTRNEAWGPALTDAQCADITNNPPDPWAPKAVA